MLNSVKSNKMIKIIFTFVITLVVCLVCTPLFQILIEIISKAGRIVGTYIRLYCQIC